MYFLLFYFYFYLYIITFYFPDSLLDGQINNAVRKVNIDALRFHVSIALFSFADLYTFSKHFMLKPIVHHNLVIDSVVSLPNVELRKLINNELCRGSTMAKRARG